MAERVSTPADEHQIQLSPSLFSSGTYVVQIPKDQIYRIPPPENALIVERHRNPATTSNRRCSRCVRISVSVFAALLLIVILATLLPNLVRPKPPRFKINKFVVNNALNSRRKFDIKLKVENPNGKGSISFKQGGRATLSFRKQEVASGKYPSFSQEHGSSQQISLSLPAKTSVALPKMMQKSMKNTKTKLAVSLSLKMNLPAQRKAGILPTRNVKYAVDCSFTVNTLAKGSRILSQECETKQQ